MGDGVANTNCPMTQSPCSMPYAVADSGSAMGNAVTNTNRPMT